MFAASSGNWTCYTNILEFYPSAYASVPIPQMLIEGSLTSILLVHQWLFWTLRNCEDLAKINRAWLNPTRNGNYYKWIGILKSQNSISFLLPTWKVVFLNYICLIEFLQSVWLHFNIESIPDGIQTYLTPLEVRQTWVPQSN